jgi:hypothetical protein
MDGGSVGRCWECRLDAERLSNGERRTLLAPEPGARAAGARATLRTEPASASATDPLLPDSVGGGKRGVTIRASVAAVSRARVCRQRAMRHCGEQTRCGRRPVRGRPQGSHRPALSGVRTSAAARLPWVRGRPPLATTRARRARREVDDGAPTIRRRRRDRLDSGTDGAYGAVDRHRGCVGVAGRATIFRGLHTAGPHSCLG